MNACRIACHVVSRALVLGLLLAVASFAARAADSDEIAELRRAIEALKAENQAMARRLATLEAQQPAARTTATAAEPAARANPAGLEERVKELEQGKAAQEAAVRTIIRESVKTLGSKINESASLGGTLGVTLGRATDFSGARQSSIRTSAVDFELDLQANDWVHGHIKLEHVDAQAGPPATVERVAVDTAYVALGDPQRFPLTLSTGRMVVPFGISTGRPVADVLSANSPLTVEAFETRQNALMFATTFPTPALAPPTPPVVTPPVQPRLFAPFVRSMAGRMGYRPPPARLQPLAPTAFVPEPPPFNAGLYVYDDQGLTGGGLKKHYGVTAGYQAQGHCGRPYHELGGNGLCPWTVNVDLSYISSVFNSRFLESEYDAFLDEIGRIPGASASVKAALGRFSLVGEWNGATRHARFTDDASKKRSIRPTAWQVSLGYQFDWNPWVQEIGAQGTYVAIGYSRSNDLAGVMKVLDVNPVRVGFVPRKRVLLTVGEWVTEGLRLVVEYSRDWDYSPAEGGTGRLGKGLFTSLTYVW